MRTSIAAATAGSAGRGLPRRRRRPRLPARPADPGAAHPPGEGDQQHLHRAGAAGRHGRRCTRSTTARTGCGGSPSRSASTGSRLARPTLPTGGVEVEHDLFFDTVRALVPGRARAIVAAARERGINLWADGDDAVQISVSEATTAAHLRAVAAAFGVQPGAGRRPVTASGVIRARPLRGPRRTSEFLTHPVFHAHRSETAMLRYLRRLSDKDLALDRTMIPLGSCTMKLNATAEMEAITWPEFADLHPFAPVEDAAGAARADRAAGVAGSPRSPATTAVSLQPNAGSQGELAGLLAIRAYHRSRGDDHRDRLPDPGVSARHQRGQRGDGRDAGRGRRHRRRRQHRPVRPARQDRPARREARRDHGHLPVHPRGVRGRPSPRSPNPCTPPAGRSTSTGRT